MSLTITIAIIIFSISLAANAIFSLYISCFFNVNSIIHKRKRLLAYRQGVDWGLTLFSRSEEIDGKLIEVTGTANPPRRTEEIRQEIKDGKWDIVLEKYEKSNYI